MTPEPGSTSDPSDVDPGHRPNTKAVLSVAFGIAGFAAALFSGFGGFILALPAVTTGIHARREIRVSHEAGDLVAVIGLTMGATTLVLLLVDRFVTGVLT